MRPSTCNTQLNKFILEVIGITINETLSAYVSEALDTFSELKSYSSQQTKI